MVRERPPAEQLVYE